MTAEGPGGDRAAGAVAKPRVGAVQWNAVAPALGAIPLAEECVRYAATLRPILDLPRDAEILEAGCGAGRMLRALDRFGFTRLTGLEVSGERLRAVRAAGPPAARLVLASGLPFRDASFDAVVSAAVIEHVEDPRGWLAELARVTRPGGRVSIATDTLMWRWLQALGLYRSAQPLDRAVPPARMLAWAHESGLALVGCGGFENTPAQRHYFARQVLLRKPAAVWRRLFGARGAAAPAAAHAMDARAEADTIVAAARAFPFQTSTDIAGCTWGYECYYWFGRVSAP